jgi:glucose-6-phosphate 1-epimerase
MPQHGFLRTNFWKADESSAFDNEADAGIRFSLDLKDVKSSRGGKWDESTEYDCRCIYTVKISASKMTTSLEITNTGDKAFDFQTLQHTYFMVDGQSAQDSAQCYVSGLEGYTVVDKVSKTEYANGEVPVVIPDNVDRVYNPPDGKDRVEVIIGVGAGNKMKLHASGTLDGKSTPVSCVVWNPYKEVAATMADFGDDQVRLSGFYQICPRNKRRTHGI